MRKVFLVLLALSLSGMFIACSEDDSSTIPTPEPEALDITTDANLTGYTCSPINIQMEAVGGTEPYTWSLASGSTLPAGMELTADGWLTGMFDNTGSHNFSIVCEDAEGGLDQLAFNLDVSVPSNPSLAIFFDEEASTCCTETQAFATLDCYVYIMLDETQYDCAKGASFSIDLVDAEGNSVDPSKYYYMYTDIDETRTISLGTISSGLALTFTNPMQYYGPIEVVKFGLMLLEDIDELAFRFGPNPDEVPERSAPIFMSCEDGYPLYEVTGRDAAVNYSTQ